MVIEDKESKINYLKSKGWNYLSTEENWVDGNRIYNYPDWVGVSLDSAFNHVKNNESLYKTVTISNKNVIVGNKWKEKGEKDLIAGEIVQKVKQLTMDGIMYEQYLVRTKYGVGGYFAHEIMNLEESIQFNYN
jgi:hypothetical protein